MKVSKIKDLKQVLSIHRLLLAHKTITLKLYNGSEVKGRLFTLYFGSEHIWVNKGKYRKISFNRIKDFSIE